MAAIELTPKQRQAMKASAHALKPVVLLGAAGLNAATLREIDRALAAHELIKVRVPVDDRTERERICGEIATTLSAVRVQQIGKLLVLFRPAPVEEPVQQSASRRDPGTTGRAAGKLNAPRKTGRAR